MYEKACDGGIVAKCYNLGHLYFEGEGVTKDLKHAATLFRKSCDGGVPEGCLNLGVMHKKGEGVPKDIQKSEELFSRAGIIDAEREKRIREEFK